MLRLSRKLMFAIEAVADIAYNAADVPVQSKDIAARQDIPRRYLEQVLQRLVHSIVVQRAATVAQPLADYVCSVVIVPEPVTADGAPPLRVTVVDLIGATPDWR